MTERDAPHTLRAELTRAFRADDIAAYRSLTGTDEALDTVPEPLIAGLLSALLGTKVPGRGTNYLKQELRYRAPVPIGVPLTATVEVTRVRRAKRLVDLATTCTLPDGTVVADGRALVLAADVTHWPPAPVERREPE